MNQLIISVAGVCLIVWGAIERNRTVETITLTSTINPNTRYELTINQDSCQVIANQLSTLGVNVTNQSMEIPVVHCGEDVVNLGSALLVKSWSGWTEYDPSSKRPEITSRQTSGLLGIPNKVRGLLL